MPAPLAFSIPMIIPIFALMIPISVIMIPIVAILTAHQRKMAEIAAYVPKQNSDAEIAALRHEVRQLTDLLHRQTITMDDISSRVRSISSTEQLRDRVGAGS